MLIDHLLHGHLVLVVHESAFQGDYLARVLADAGAAVAGPVATGEEAIALVHDGDWPCSMVLSHAAQGSRSLIDAARRHGTAALIVYPARALPELAGLDTCLLANPCGGFQVVEALADLLAREPHVEAERAASPAFMP